MQLKIHTWGIFGLGMLALGTTNHSVRGQQGPPPPPPGALGGPLVGLTQPEMALFNQGRGEFGRPRNQLSGLGPVFNGISCVQCHNAGAPGGASSNLGVSVVTRFGGIVNGNYSDLANLGGALVQARSLREFIPNYPVPREVVPPQAQFVGRRITTPIFGLGLIEAIPAETILARSGVPQGNGVVGVANMVFNPDTLQTELGRFGWKAQMPTIHSFTGDAFLNEMGITNPTFPEEVLPQGLPIPPGADLIPDPEDEVGDEVERVTNFQRLSAPPPPLPPTAGSTAGAIVFNRVACNSCHVQSMTTGTSPIQALSLKVVNLYSDLLLHNMGAGLADGLRQGQAAGSQYRTAPLWGLRFRRDQSRFFLLHDGRAASIEQAILLHGGEAAFSRNQFMMLDKGSRNQLLEFLSRL